MIATTNGKAFYVFVSLLKRLGISYETKLPWEIEEERHTPAVLLTTKSEAPKGWRGRAVFLEDLIGDEILDLITLVSKLVYRRKDELIVGVDPGGTIGLAVFYKGMLVHSKIYPDVKSVCEIVNRLLRANAKYYVVKLGTGHPVVAEKIAEELAPLLSRGVVLELVDESGTTSKHKGLVKAYRDISAAISIAMREGKRLGADLSAKSRT